MKRLLLIALVILAAGAFTVTPAFAMEECDHTMTHEPTVAGLAAHVENVYAMGHISSTGVMTELLALLKQAQAFADRGQVSQEVKVLQAFVAAVDAQAGTQIAAGCAEHLVQHAGEVIAAAQG